MWVVFGTFDGWCSDSIVLLFLKVPNMPMLIIILINLHYVVTINKQRAYIRLVPFQRLLCIFVKLTQSNKHHRLYQLWRKPFIFLWRKYLQVLLPVEPYSVAVFNNVRWVVVHDIKYADVKYLVKLKYRTDCFLLGFCWRLLFIVLFVY